MTEQCTQYLEEWRKRLEHRPRPILEQSSVAQVTPPSTDLWTVHTRVQLGHQPAHPDCTQLRYYEQLSPPTGGAAPI